MKEKRNKKVRPRLHHRVRNRRREYMRNLRRACRWASNLTDAQRYFYACMLVDVIEEETGVRIGI